MDRPTSSTAEPDCTALVAALSVGTLVCRRDGRILAVNASALRALGWEGDSAPGDLSALLAQAPLCAPDGKPFAPGADPFARALRGETFAELRAARAGGLGELLTYRAVPLDGPSEAVLIQIQTRDRGMDTADRLRSAADAAGIGTFHLDLESGRLEFDAVLYRLFGLEADGKVRCVDDGLALVHPEDRAAVAARLDEIAAEGNALDLRFRCTWRDGSVHWLAARGNTRFDPAGHPLAVAGACLDVTARVEAEAARELSDGMLRQVTDAVPVLIAYVDADLRYQFTNATYTRWFGLEAEALRGRRLAEVLPAETLNIIRPYMEAALRGERVVYNREIVFPAIGRRFVQGQYIPHQVGGRIAGFVVVVTDLTEERRTGEQQAQLAGIVASSHEAILSKTLAGIITSWNAGAERIYGWRAEEVVGKSIGLLIHPDRGDELEAILEPIRAGRPVEALRTVRLRKDGSTVHVLLSVAPMRAPDGQIIGAAAIERDITERKEMEDALQRSEERFRLALRNSPVIIFNQDRELRYTWMHNPRGEFLESEVVGRCDAELLENEGEAAEMTALKKRVLGTGEPSRQEVRVSTGERVRFYDLSLEPSRNDDGTVVGLVGVAIDITERRRLEAQLREQAAQLREADRRKDEFIAMLGHELRNPLAPIRNAIELLKHQTQDLPERAVWARDLIDRQVDQMTRLVDDLLDVARITRGQIRLRKSMVELAEVLSQAVESVRPLLDERGQSLDIDLRGASTPLYADPVRLAQIVANLLNNAAKYTPEHGHIALSGERDGQDVVIRVRDDGIGIAPEALPRIFDMFSRADGATQRAQHGLGLGLTLVRSLLELHGGTVEAHSEGEGRGAEFVVRLPCGLETGEAPAVPPQREERRPHRLLVVDDNADVADSFAMLLNALGYEASTAYSGEAALEAALRTEPTVAFLDIGMPGMDGYELARRLRREVPSVRLVALTGYRPGPGEEQTALFDRHLLKPPDLSAVEKLLHELV